MSKELLGRCPDCEVPIAVMIQPGLPAGIPDHGCAFRTCEYTGCRARRPADAMVQFSTASWFCPTHAVFLAASDLVSLYRTETEPDWKGISEVLAEALPEIVRKFERTEGTVLA